MNTFIYIYGSKVTVKKDIYNITKISISNKYCSIKLFLMNRTIKVLFIKESCKNVSWFPQKHKAAQLFSTLIIIRNVSCAPNQHILE